MPLLTFGEDGTVQLTLHLSNFLFLFQDHLYIDAYLSSLKIALHLDGSRAARRLSDGLFHRPLARPLRAISSLMLVILPFWSSFLLRVYAWIGFLKNNGVINNLLGLFHIGRPSRCC